ncbi:MAG: hypothetical protein U9Q85_01570 [Patescibacteria group bacterium]|nr:hypothetical protein [Patescibacteria group bacterium]
MLRELAHLQDKDFLPTQMTPGERIYDILDFLEVGEMFVVGHTMVKRAKEMNANLGKEDGEYILKHQNDIPVALREKVVFIFSDWHLSGFPGDACFVCWLGDEWIRRWYSLGGGGWGCYDRLLRRK